MIPGALMEIRGLGRSLEGYPRTLSAFFDDPDQAAGLAAWMSDKNYAVYFTINPVSAVPPLD